MKLRRAKSARDVGTAVRMDLELFGEDQSMDVQPADAYWLVWDKQDTVAFAGARVVGSGGDAVCYFHRAGVLRRARGVGLQRKLIRARLAWAKKANCVEAVTYTDPLNVVSSNNLIATGFRLYRPEYRWVGDSFLYWWRGL